MNINEENQTKKWIIEALFELLHHKNYHDITILKITDKAGLGRRTFYRYFKTKDEVIAYTTKLLMNEFADTIVLNKAETQEDIVTAYFEFWENYIDVLLLLNKAHLLYFFEENLVLLVYEVAKKIGHVPEGKNQEELRAYYHKYKYAFEMKLAGLWKATIIWALENPRKSPEEMSILINDILK